MVHTNDMTDRFTRYANVGDLVIVLLVVVILVMKPAGAIMV